MLKLGAQNVKGMYLGGQEVKQAYLGSELVFDVGGLPAGYTVLEYIQSSGTQYINTGFAPNNNTRVVADFQYTNIGTNGSVFGARKSFDNSAYQIIVVSGKYRSDYNNVYTQVWDGANPLNRNVVDKKAETTTIAGDTKSYDNVSFQCGIPMYIFACNNNGTGIYLSSGRLFSLQIHDNGTKVRDFVPCSNSSSVIGLYDLVNAKFYGNSGTGNFTAGPAV